jgi:quinol monooxygenase YgiN
VWSQLITMRVKPGKEDRLAVMLDQLRAVEQPDSGLVRQTFMRDQKDPNLYRMLVLFESEEKAREREGDPRREEGLTAIRSTMMDLIDGPPEYADMTIVDEWSH